eukprot:scaffold20958_cov129-Isochrysis_galbana.AAC.2
MVLAVNGGVEALTLSMTTTVLDGLIACYNGPCLQWPDAVNGGCAACAPGSAHVASAVRPRINKPITVTDVQSDGRPLALPRDSDRAPHVCAEVAAE